MIVTNSKYICFILILKCCLFSISSCRGQGKPGDGLGVLAQSTQSEHSFHLYNAIQCAVPLEFWGQQMSSSQ